MPGLLHTPYRATSVIAVDWSGDTRQARSRIYLAEATMPGQLERLECGRDRAELAEHLLAQTHAVIGLDFGFSFPAHYLDALGVRSAPELWRLGSECGEAWIADCALPFWGRPGRPRPQSAALFRRTELAVPSTQGVRPKSMFQLGGAGSVGTGSVRGMPLLYALHRHGARIWPYTQSGAPTVVEIYPRLLTGPVRKSRADERRALLADRYPGLDDSLRQIAIASEDAFDAAVSALVMIGHLPDLAHLPTEADHVLGLEGRIWHPAWRDDPI
jgi:hypothetical protein